MTDMAEIVSEKESIILSRLSFFAEKTPKKIAFTDCEGNAITYGALLEKVRSLAAGLLLYFGGKMPERPIAVAVGRDIPSVVGMFGVLAAGGWYLPLDAELSEQRLSLLLSVSEPALVLWATNEEPKGNFTVPVIKPQALCQAEPIALPISAEDQPMFGIFTSGSTGVPKLVVKSRRAIEKFIEVYCRTFGFFENEVFGNQIPFYFDASTKDLFATVVLGATSVILPQKLFSFPVDLVKTLNDYRISTVVWVPSALAIAARFDVFSAELPKYLKNILFVGEKMPVKYLNVWREALPEATFVNLYGSTEVAGNSAYYRVDRTFSEKEILPIGFPFEGTRVFLLDEKGNSGEEGEICVAGEGLAIGYDREKEKTDSVFTEISLPEENFSGRIYRSGDYGKRNEKGELVCLSRKDDQIKHMGHRIALGEIDAAAMSLAYLEECCCLYDPLEEKIYLYYSAKEECKKQLHRALCEKLPKYMVPHKLVYMENLPHNRNGKIDRAALMAIIAEKNKP